MSDRRTGTGFEPGTYAAGRFRPAGKKATS